MQWCAGVILVLVLLDNAVAKELGGSEKLFDVGKGLVADGDPGEDHDAVGDGAELRVHGVRAVGLLELGDGHERVVDGLEQVLVQGHVGALQVGLDGLCGDEEKLALGLEAGHDVGGLLGDEASDLVAAVHIVGDGRVDKGVKVLNGFGQLLGDGLLLRRRRRRRGSGRRGSRGIGCQRGGGRGRRGEGADILGDLGRRGNVFEARGGRFESGTGERLLAESPSLRLAADAVARSE